MKKVLILNVDNKFVCHVNEISPKLPNFGDGTNLVASFDVSDVFMHV